MVSKCKTLQEAKPQKNMAEFLRKKNDDVVTSMAPGPPCHATELPQIPVPEFRLLRKKTPIRQDHALWDRGGWDMNPLSGWMSLMLVGLVGLVGSVITTSSGCKQPSWLLTMVPVHVRWPKAALPPRARLPTLLQVLHVWRIAMCLIRLKEAGNNWVSGKLYHSVTMSYRFHIFSPWLVCQDCWPASW